MSHHVDASHHCERDPLCSVGSEVDGEQNKVWCEAFVDGGPLCVGCEQDLGEVKKRGIETQNETAIDPWDPTMPGCHTVHSDSVGLVSSEGTCCAGLCRQQCG